MASVYKRSRRKPIPEGAEIIQRGGKRLAVWMLWMFDHYKALAGRVRGKTWRAVAN